MRAAIFDFGGVLGTGNAAWSEAIQAEFGMPRSQWRPLVAGANGVETLLGGKPFTTADMVPVLAERLRPHLGDSAEAAARRMCGAFTDRAAGELFQPMMSLVKSLHEAGVTIGMLSNGPADAPSGRMGDVLASGYIDAVVLSGADGVGKPSPAAFALILERLNVQAHEAVFIDDDADLAAAGRDFGLSACVFDGNVVDLEQRLRDFGLRW